MTQFLLVQTTLESQEDAARLAEVMTEKRLSACCQIEGPITSVYWWKGKLEQEQEWKCSFKTSKTLFPKLAEAIKEIHPYETPEIIAVSIEDGSQEYLSWLQKELQ